MVKHPSRRDVLTTATTVCGAAAVAMAIPRTNESSEKTFPAQLSYCLNTGTIRGQQLDLREQIDVAASAGYDGIEPWIDDIQKYKDAGGSLADIAKRCADYGLKVASAIGFAQWIVDNTAQRTHGLETARRDMELVRQIGGLHIAAPPAGATNTDSKIDLLAAAERYAELLRVGEQIGVIPQVEVWGFSHNLSRLGEAVFVAVEAGHPNACVLPDVYHIYKGGSDHAGVNLLGRQAIHCFHVNDYPAHPLRQNITDAHRVYPGDGVAPLKQILSGLLANHSKCMLSLELFNREYWQQDATMVARNGLQKMKDAVAMVVSPSE